MMSKNHEKEQGFLVIMAIIVIAIFGVLGVMATYLFNNSVLTSTSTLGSMQALYIAEAGLEKGVRSLLNSVVADRIPCTQITGNAGLTNFTFSGAKGPFTVTASGPQSSTASVLNGAIDANATTIPIINASSYAASGRIVIDREAMDYSIKSGNSLINVRRGVDGTTAVAHANGAPVAQYQCSLTSTAGVPNLAPAGNTIGGQRSLQQSVQLEEAWVVGTNASLIHWNKPTELQWTATTIPGLTVALNSVFMLSYADAWAVGPRYGGFTIQHWNGNSWTAFGVPSWSGAANALSSVTCTASNFCEAVGQNRTFLGWNGIAWAGQSANAPNVDFNSVSCTTANDCWAVGDSSGNTDVFERWNGVAWSQDPSTPTPNKSDLNSVWCNASNDCWAVGTVSGIFHWNGMSWSGQSVQTNATYNGVTCTLANDCWAVGNNLNGSLIVHWNGTAWSRVLAPSGIVANLKSVSCSNSTNCFAVGDSAIVLRWDGSNWTVVSNPIGATNTLNSVSIVGYHSQPASGWQEIFI